MPKTGGNSIQNALSKYSEDKIVVIGSHQDGIERFEVRNEIYPFTKHSTLNDYRKFVEKNLFDQLYKFATNRNPWDMMVSFYFSPHRNVDKWYRTDFTNLLKRVKTLREFITTRENRPIDLEIDWILRFENLNEDFAFACKRIGIPYTLLLVRNKSKRNQYSYYYDEDLFGMQFCPMATISLV